MTQPEDVFHLQIFLQIKGELNLKQKVLARVILFCIIFIQQYALIIIAIDLSKDSQFYQTRTVEYITLRYFLVFISFFIFQKDVSSLVMEVQILANYANTFSKGSLIYTILLHIVVRYATVLMNATIVFVLIVTTNLGRDQGIGLILNFAAAVIVVEFDDFVAQLYFYKRF